MRRFSCVARPDSFLARNTSGYNLNARLTSSGPPAPIQQASTESLKKLQTSCSHRSTACRLAVTLRSYPCEGSKPNSYRQENSVKQLSALVLSALLFVPTVPVYGHDSDHREVRH